MAHKACVFIVDMDASNCRAVGELAASMNVDSAGYASAEEFLAAFDESHCGSDDSETRLLNMSGLELIAHLSPLRLRVPILLLGAHVDVPLAVEAMRLGADAVFEKPRPSVKLACSIDGAALMVTGEADPCYVRTMSDLGTSTITLRNRNGSQKLVTS